MVEELGGSHMQGCSLHSSRYRAWMGQVRACRKSSLRPGFFFFFFFFLILRVDSKREGRGREGERETHGSIEY